MSISRTGSEELVRIEMRWSYWAVVEGVVGGSGVICGWEVGGGSGGSLRLVVGLVFTWRNR